MPGLLQQHHLARVKARVRKGGHDIPEADIRRRFDQSRLQLIQLLPHLTELRVYDNTDEADPHLGMPPQPRLVLHWQAGQVLAPADATAMAQTPAWVKPVVMAALKGALKGAMKASLKADGAARDKPAALKPVSAAGVRPKQSRPAKSP